MTLPECQMMQQKSLPAKILRAVDFPIPLVPTSPKTHPGLGVGNLCNLKELAEYLCVVSLLKFDGKLIIPMASKGHFLTQIPHPMHNSSEMKAILSFGVTSMQSLPIRTTGQDFLHSCRHLFGLHLSLFTIAIRVSPCVSSFSFLLSLGGIFSSKNQNAALTVYTCFIFFFREQSCQNLTSNKAKRDESFKKSQTFEKYQLTAKQSVVNKVQKLKKSCDEEAFFSVKIESNSTQERKK